MRPTVVISKNKLAIKIHTVYDTFNHAVEKASFSNDGIAFRYIFIYERKRNYS